MQIGGTINGDGNVQQPDAIDYAAKTYELQTIIEKQTAELSQWQRRVSDLNNKINELEDNLSKIQKEFSKSQEQCSKLQRDLRENVAQKEDQVKIFLLYLFYFMRFLPFDCCFYFVYININNGNKI